MLMLQHHSITIHIRLLSLFPKPKCIVHVSSHSMFTALISETGRELLGALPVGARPAVPAAAAAGLGHQGHPARAGTVGRGDARHRGGTGPGTYSGIWIA